MLLDDAMLSRADSARRPEATVIENENCVMFLGKCVFQ